MSPSFVRTYKYLCIAVLGLIALGGGVRTMNAGLACPDWPLCFGDIIPDYHPEVYFEFIHRVWAGLVGILTLAAHIVIFRSKSVTRETKWVALLSLILLVAQIVMGGLTVLKLLQFSVVTTHLLLGTGFLGSLAWVYLLLSQPKQKNPDIPAFNKLFLFIPVLAVYFQIFLGGLVATSYAGLACNDFPLCNGMWVPTLEGPVGLQVIHRFGAYFVALMIITAFYTVRSKSAVKWVTEEHKKVTSMMLSGVIFQITLGVMNVKFFTPPLITVAHLALAACILALGLKLIYISRRTH
jgi:cytochrome c oxidase assembly protein subunit 15